MTTSLKLRAVLFCLLATAVIAGQRAGAEVPADDLERIWLAAPHEAPAEPSMPRTLLVFSWKGGYVHDSIPWGAAALRVLGEKTGAYTATLSDDPAMFDRERLLQFDAVAVNNCFCAGDPLPDAQHRENLLEFVRSGRGIVGIHCAVLVDWPEYIEMLGGRSVDHPWNEGSTVVVKLDEPDHPLVRCFAGSPFFHTDEIYRFDRFSRENSRVLLSLDSDRTDMSKPGIAPAERDFPLSWVRRYGQGRVFYSALGHQKDVYWQPVILKHYLAGIQFALGDLTAEAEGSLAAQSSHSEGRQRVN